MELNLEEIKVRVKVIENLKLKAIISLDFGDFIIKGFRVEDSKFENDRGEKLWLKPPSYQAKGKWHPMFFIPNKNVWKQLEAMIYQEYDRQRNEHFEKRMNEDSSGGNYS